MKMNETGKGEDPEGDTNTRYQKMESRKGVNHLREGCSGINDQMKVWGQVSFQIAQAEW